MAKKKDVGSGTLKGKSVSLDKRLVSIRSPPIEKLREAAHIKVALYGNDPSKYLAKIYRGNVLVAQEIVDCENYSTEEVTRIYRSDVISGHYDEALTTTYRERKALRKGGR